MRPTPLACIAGLNALAHGTLALMAMPAGQPVIAFLSGGCAAVSAAILAYDLIDNRAPDKDKS